MAIALTQHHPGTAIDDKEQSAKMLQGGLQRKIPSTGIRQSIHSIRDPPASTSIIQQLVCSRPMLAVSEQDQEV